MKSKLLTAALVTAALIVLVTCDTGSSPAVASLPPPDFPVVFSSMWKEDNNSIGDIVRGPRYLTINSDMSFVYTSGENPGPDTNPMNDVGGFSQAKVDIGGGNYYYAWITIEGKLTYAGDGYYLMVPKAGWLDFSGIGVADPIVLPDLTVQSFREYAKISPKGLQMVIDDDPATVNGGIGFLNGTWTKQ